MAAALLPALGLPLGGCKRKEAPSPIHTLGERKASVEQVIGKAGGEVRHPANVVVQVPPDAFPADTKVTVRTADQPAGTGAKVELGGPVVELSADPPPREPFHRAVTVSIPFSGPVQEGLTAAWWSGREWRPIGGRVDPATRSVTFSTFGFSKYTVILKTWDDWPTIDVDDPNRVVREVPRGAVIQLTMRFKGTSPGTTVEGAFVTRDTGTGHQPGTIELATDPANPEAFAETGLGRTEIVGGDTSVTFLVHVPEKAALGSHDLKILLTPMDDKAKALGWPQTVPKAIEVANRKVFVLDIDGLRPDVFRALMTDGNALSTLSMIFGPVKDRDVAIRPRRAGASGEQVRADRFKNGYVVQGATTIFPSYTFAGHAAIFTGRSPGQYGIPGNEWLDRRPAEGFQRRRYAFTGAFADEGLLGLVFGRTEVGDALFSFWFPARANKMLRGDTVYDEVADPNMGLDLLSIVGFNMYLGRTRSVNWMFAGFGEQVFDFILSDHGIIFDQDMIQAVQRAMGQIDTVSTDDEGTVMSLPYQTERARQDARRAGIITLFFASLDHSGHAHYDGRRYRDTVKEVHEALMRNHIDPMIGWVVRDLDDVTLRNSLWIVVSDHGQSDVKELVKPDLRDELLKTYRMERRYTKWFVKRISPLELEDSNCAVAYNGGSAYVYLRHGAEDWSVLPSPHEVHELAVNYLREYVRAPRYFWNGKIDLILLRLPKDVNLQELPKLWDPMPDLRQTEYYVMDPMAEPVSIVKMDQYLDGNQCVFYDTDRYRWSRTDKAFLMEALQGMNCDRSGDVVILPKFPYYHFESKHCPGNHGGLVRDDMECTLAVAIPGCGAVESDQLEKLLSESIDLDRKPRVGNRDVRDIIVNYYKSRGELRRPAQLTGPLRIATRRSQSQGLACTDLLLTSEDLANLDPSKPDAGLRFTVYRAQSPKGPFDKPAGEFCFFGDDPRPKPAEGDKPLPRNTRAITVATGNVTRDLKLPHKPFYYQVAQTPIDRRRQPKGKDVRSNVAGPSGKAFINIRTEKLTDGQLKIKPDAGSYWYKFDAALSLVDQDYDCYGAHVKVSSGNWTGHFWTAREEGGRLFGEQGVNYGSSAWVQVPARNEDISVTVAAEGEGLEAGATFIIPGDLKQVAAARKRVQEIADEGAAAVKNHQARIEKAWERIGELDQELTKNGPRMAEYLKIANRRERGRQELEVRSITEIDIPRRQTSDRCDTAVAARDYAAWLAALTDQLKVLQAERDVALAREEYRDRFDSQIVACRDTPEDIRRNTENARKDRDWTKINQGIQDEYVGRVAGHNANIALAAFYAGEGAANARARLGEVGVCLERNWIPKFPALWDRLALAANELAALSGSRERAAAILMQAHQVHLHLAKPEDRSAVLGEIEARIAPAWWPAGLPYAVPKSPFKLEEFKDLSDRLTK